MKYRVVMVSLTIASLGLSGCTASNIATGPKAAPAVRNEGAVPAVPAILNIRSAATSGAEKMPAGLYYGDELVVPNVTDANLSPDGMHALWQSGDTAYLYSVKLRKQRAVARNLPSSIMEVTWNSGSIRLKLANTGEVFIDNME